MTPKTNRIPTLVLATVAFLALASVVIANPPASLTIFQAGEPIRADELNANLTFLQNALTTMATRLSVVESRVPLGEPTYVSGFGEILQNVQSTDWPDIPGASVTLPPGEWVLFGHVFFFGFTQSVAISQASAGWATAPQVTFTGFTNELRDQPGIVLLGPKSNQSNSPTHGLGGNLGSNYSVSLPPMRLRNTSTLTIYLSGFVRFSGGLMSERAYLYAHRVQ